jgi:chromosome segregation ATPase
MLHKNKGKMIVKTKLGEDKLKFTVTYLDGKKLPKDLAGKVGYALNNLGQLETLQEMVTGYFSQKQSLEADILTLKESLRMSENRHNLEKQQWHEIEILNTEKLVALENMVRDLTQQKESLSNELEIVRLRAVDKEEELKRVINNYHLVISNLEAKYQDELSLSKRMIWALVATSAVSLISLSLYFSSL